MISDLKTSVRCQQGRMPKMIRGYFVGLLIFYHIIEYHKEVRTTPIPGAF